MNLIHRKVVLVIVVLLFVTFSGGCGGRFGWGSKKSSSPEDLGVTIGSLVDILIPEPVPVEGYGVVAGLEGTGSSECPPKVREYLQQYILRQLPSRTNLNVDKFIDSPDTAVVSVQAVIPEMASKNQYFDVKVTALLGTQTISLEGGRLYTAELKMPGSFDVDTRILADAEGPVYIDKINDSQGDKRTGYVLAGGKVLEENKIVLSLKKPNYRVVNLIRNRINGRFGSNVASAFQSDRIELKVPSQFKQRKQRFISMIAAMYIEQDTTVDQKRIDTYIKRLSVSHDKYLSEVALEAIGNECLGELSDLLESADEMTRLHAGRCMLNLGSDAGLVVLRKIAQDKKSLNRVEALESIVLGARRNDAISISRKLLRDDDFRIRLAAYEQLRKLDDVSINQEFIGRSFYLEQIPLNGFKTVFVYRSGQPRIVLFGAPINCQEDIFVQSEKGEIIVNAPADQKYVNIIRKHPKRPGVITQMKCSFAVADIIRAMCEEPVGEGEKGSGGLGVSYADAAALLKKMCDMGIVKAEFHAGDMPKIALNVKK